MRSAILILIALTFSTQLFGWGEAKTKNQDDIIIISGDLPGQFVVIPKAHLVTVIDIESKALIFQYGASTKHIRVMTFDDPKNALKVLRQIYPSSFCLNELGLSECEINDILEIKED